jgi:hypothetical protein
MTTYNYNPSEGNLPKWAQQLLDELRTENIRLRDQVSHIQVAKIVKLERDWFVMPGPAEGQPSIRIWTLTEQGPQMIGVLERGQSLMFQHAPTEETPS